MRIFNKLPKPLFRRQINTLDSGSTAGRTPSAEPLPAFHPPLLTEMQPIPGSTLKRLPVTGKRMRRSRNWQKRLGDVNRLPWGWLTLGIGVGSCLMFFLMAAS